MKLKHTYSKLWSLYSQAQNAKYQRINPVEVFNSRLHDKFMHIEINGADISGIYYKFTDESCRTRVLGSNNVCLFELETDKLAGRVDGETEMLSDFWSLLYCYNWRDVPAPKQIEYLEAAGVQPGFFTFTAANETTEFYFNPECKGYPLMDKEEYDSYWRPFQNDNWNKNWCDPNEENWCEPGDIVEGNNGRQFVVNQDGKIDVQYGDDVLSLHPMKVIGHSEE